MQGCRKLGDLNAAFTLEAWSKVTKETIVKTFCHIGFINRDETSEVQIENKMKNVQD